MPTRGSGILCANLHFLHHPYYLYHPQLRD